MGNLSQFRVDTKKLSDGVWRDFGAGIKVRIARLHNPKFNKFYAEISEPYRNQIRAGNLDVEVLSGLMKQAVANHVILDWKGLEDDEGKAIRYSPEKALEIISDPANVISQLRADVATSFYSFLEEQKKASVKN